MSLNRAAIIVTHIPVVYWDGGPFNADVAGICEPSQQLLADLRILSDPDWNGAWADLVRAAARVRALLPKEGDEDE